MKLDRNLSPGHPGKYALINIRRLQNGEPTYSGHGNEFITVNSAAVDFGSEIDFFLIKLHDKYAEAALSAYAKAAAFDDPEYAEEILSWRGPLRGIPENTGLIK